MQIHRSVFGLRYFPAQVRFLGLAIDRPQLWAAWLFLPEVWEQLRPRVFSVGRGDRLFGRDTFRVFFSSIDGPSACGLRRMSCSPSFRGHAACSPSVLCCVAVIFISQDRQQRACLTPDVAVIVQVSQHTVCGV